MNRCFINMHKRHKRCNATITKNSETSNCTSITQGGLTNQRQRLPITYDFSKKLLQGIV